MITPLSIAAYDVVSDTTIMSVNTAHCHKTRAVASRGAARGVPVPRPRRSVGEGAGQGGAVCRVVHDTLQHPARPCQHGGGLLELVLVTSADTRALLSTESHLVRASFLSVLHDAPRKHWLPDVWTSEYPILVTTVEDLSTSTGTDVVTCLPRYGSVCNE